jgi:mono/diheme cytochrome c family protein
LSAQHAGRRNLIIKRKSKMKKVAALSLALTGCVLIVLSGCSKNSDYMPSAGATGESIFKEACVNCHSPVNGRVMLLRPEMANSEALIERIKNGKGFGMPAFPNLTGDSVQMLADYLLENAGTLPDKVE